MGNGMVNQLTNEIKLVSALRDRQIHINDTIDDDMALETTHYMRRIYQEDCKRLENIPNYKVDKNITLLIDTYGGQVWSGNAIIGEMNHLKSKGYSFTGIVTSKCFSMGFDVLCNCDVRLGYSHSEYMIHQSQTNTPYGDLVKAERIIEYNKKQWEKSTEYYIKDTKLSKEILNDLYERCLEWFMLSEEALSLNVIQEII